jgi:transcriptional regulator with XRE-family HTH domain
VARLGAMSTGRRIARLRGERGLSQSGLAAALAAASGRSTVTREEVSRWERDRRSPTPYWLSHLAAILRVPPEALRPLLPGPWPDGDSDAVAEALAWLVTEPPQVTARRSSRRVGKSLADSLRHSWRASAGYPGRADNGLDIDEPICARCGAPVALFPDQGMIWHHFRGPVNPTSDPQPIYNAGDPA